MTEILCRDRSARTQRVRLVVMHVNVGPDTHAGAVSVAKYCQTIEGGYHEIVDDVQYVTTARDNEVVNGAAGANADGYHICMIGDANQTPAEWHDAFSVCTWTRAAQRAHEACARLGVPMRLLSAAEVASGQSGICGHVHVSQAFRKSDHTDPGPNFPWAEFIAQVAAQEDNDMNADQDARLKRIEAAVNKSLSIDTANRADLKTFYNYVVASFKKLFAKLGIS